MEFISNQILQRIQPNIILRIGISFIQSDKIEIAKCFLFYFSFIYQNWICCLNIIVFIITQNIYINSDTQQGKARGALWLNRDSYFILLGSTQLVGRMHNFCRSDVHILKVRCTHMYGKMKTFRRSDSLLLSSRSARPRNCLDLTQQID